MFNLHDIGLILDIAKQAGDITLKYYSDSYQIDAWQKSDLSPVTKADLLANRLIIDSLYQLFPRIGVVSEENDMTQNFEVAKSNRYFIIDPLDGTSGFIKGLKEFTVNIGLIENHKVSFGVIYVPAKDIMYFTDEDHQAVKIKQYSMGLKKKETIRVSNLKNNITVICTTREPEKSAVITYLKAKNITTKEIISVASSYKFCLIAEGKADLYIRKVSISAWDIAAGHAIVKAAGGNVFDSTTNLELTYNFSNNHQFFNIPLFMAY